MPLRAPPEIRTRTPRRVRGLSALCLPFHQQGECSRTVAPSCSVVGTRKPLGREASGLVLGATYRATYMLSASGFRCKLLAQVNTASSQELDILVRANDEPELDHLLPPCPEGFTVAAFRDRRTALT